MPDGLGLLFSEAPLTFETVVARLEELGEVREYSSGDVMACCPVHDDNTPSMSVTIADDGHGFLAYCFVCSLEMPQATWFTELIKAVHSVKTYAPPIGTPRPMRKPRVKVPPRKPRCFYEYVDDDGRPIARKVRYNTDVKADRFSMQRAIPHPAQKVLDPETRQRVDRPAGVTWTAGLGPDGIRNLPLYMQREALDEAAKGGTIWLTEGESDVLRAQEAGLAGACSSGAVKTFRSDHAQLIARAIEGGGAGVIVAADNDPAGLDDATLRMRLLVEAGVPTEKVLILRPPADGHDLSDHLNAGLGVGELVPVVEVRDPRSDPQPQADSDPAPAGRAESQADAEDAGAAPPPGIADLPLPNEFWKRPVLAHIRIAARAGGAAPDSVLASVLSRMIAGIPPGVVVATGVGNGRLSLNRSDGLVGDSGVGKGISDAVASAAFTGFADLPGVQPGSGEGLASHFVRRLTPKESGEALLAGADPQSWAATYAWRTRHGRFVVNEVDTLTAIASRAGSTTDGELRKVFLAESLGFANKPENRLDVPAGEYRAALWLCIQPERAFSLLDKADGGTPQRITWWLAYDPYAPDEPPPVPAPWKWHMPGLPLTDPFGRPTRRMHLPGSALTQMRAARRQALRGELRTNDLAGHRLTRRIKDAAALALLDGRGDIDDDDWRLAGLISEASDRVLRFVEGRIELAGRRGEEQKTRDYIRRDRAINGDREEQRTVRVVAKILDTVGRHAEGHEKEGAKGCSNRCMSQMFNGRGGLRDLIPDALDRLTGTGQLIFDGERIYRP